MGLFARRPEPVFFLIETPFFFDKTVVKIRLGVIALRLGEAAGDVVQGDGSKRLRHPVRLISLVEVFMTRHARRVADVRHIARDIEEAQRVVRRFGSRLLRPLG